MTNEFVRFAKEALITTDAYHSLIEECSGFEAPYETIGPELQETIFRDIDDLQESIGYLLDSADALYATGELDNDTKALCDRTISRAAEWNEDSKHLYRSIQEIVFRSRSSVRTLSDRMEQFIIGNIDVLQIGESEEEEVQEDDAEVIGDSDEGTIEDGSEEGSVEDSIEEEGVETPAEEESAEEPAEKTLEETLEVEDGEPEVPKTPQQIIGELPLEVQEVVNGLVLASYRKGFESGIDSIVSEPVAEEPVEKPLPKKAPAKKRAPAKRKPKTNPVKKVAEKIKDAVQREDPEVEE